MLFGKLIRHYSRYLLRTLLPPSCVLCGTSTGQALNLCAACLHDLPILSHRCRQCAQILPLSDKMTAEMALVCGTCLRQPPPFDRTFALLPYEQQAIHFVIALKFQHQLSHAKLLGDLLSQQIQQHWYCHEPWPDIIIPIPLHPLRLRERGYNQAIEIARPIARALHIPIDVHGIKRIKHTAAQSGLHADQRKLNMANAFKLEKNYTGLHIAVIDDVITTGHTMTECCRLLQQAGAKRIDVWCCARRDIALSPKTL